MLGTSVGKSGNSMRKDKLCQQRYNILRVKGNVTNNVLKFYYKKEKKALEGLTGRLDTAEERRSK